MNKRVAVGVVCFVSTFFALNSGAVTFAENLTQFSIDVSDAALQLTVPPTASIELNPTSSNAVFGTTNVTVSVATNNMNGYRLSMSVPTTDLIHNSLANTVIPTLSNSAPESTFPANAWGYKVVDNDYLPVLKSNTPDSWFVEEPTNGTNHIVNLAAKVDGSKPSGAYETTLTFNVVTNPNAPRDTVVFNANNTNATGSTPSQLVFRGEPTILNGNGFSVEGYDFAYWNTRADGLGVSYRDLDTFIDGKALSAATTTINLYAQWVENSGQSGGSGYAGKTLQDAFEQAYVRNENNSGHYYDTNAGRYKKGLYVPRYDGTYFEATEESDYDGIPANDLRFAIQDIGLTIDGVSVCDYATMKGSEAVVLDLRDYKSYRIAKMQDGRCWMLDNLALNLVDTNVQSVLDSTNTNASDESINYLINGAGAAGRSGYRPESGVYDHYYGSANQNPIIYTAYKDSVAKDSSSFVVSDEAYNWKTGIFYNYCAATAGYVCPGPYKSPIDIADTAIDSPEDVCPFGWRLPTGGPLPANGGETYGGEYSTLYNSYSGDSGVGVNGIYWIFRKAFHITLTGSSYSGNEDAGQKALIRSSTYKNGSTTYGLSVTKIEQHVVSPISELGYSSKTVLRCINKNN